MNHIYLTRLILLKRPGFQSPKYGMPTYIIFSAKYNLTVKTENSFDFTYDLQQVINK